MRFCRPSWLSHQGDKKDHEVYSCHVSPDGSRLATAAGDGHVRIWSTKAILNANKLDASEPKQLASLAYHSGTVHSVRFSPNGKYLASGADDKIVCIYNLDPSPPAHTSFGSKEAPPVENWRIFRRLIGHDNDVQDLGWSYDSSILVSVGLDSKVVVWSGHTFEKLKTLAQHQSHVKGITFDPANKYFATASDDRTIKVFRFTPPPANASASDQTSNFVLETSINAPFGTSPLTTYFRRLSWSPEGAHIAAANAVNGPVSSVAIIDRGSWTSEINLIGHEGPVEVCAFSPRLFCKEPPPAVQAIQEGISPGAVTVVACAGQDKTLSVWNTSLTRPFITLTELCVKSISDLAWSPEGQTLYLTSLDGTIAALEFETQELGYPAPTTDNEKALGKFGAGRRTALVESTDALKLEEESKAGELKNVEGRMGELMGNTTASDVAEANGSDRVTTIQKQTSTATTSNEEADRGSVQPPPPPKDPQAEKIDKLKQRITITKDGKKRIAPLLVSSSGQSESNIPKPQLQSAIKQTASDAPATIIDLSKPYDGLPKGGIASLVIGNRRKYAEIEGDDERRNEKRIHTMQQSGATPVLKNTADGLVQANGSNTQKPTDVPEPLRPAVVNPSLTVSPIRLAVPLMRAVITRPLDITRANGDTEMANGQAADPEGNESVVFEARNATGPSRTGRAQDKEPTKITVSRRGQILWQDFLPKAALLVTGNRHFWAVGCEDGTLHLWTPAGRRLMNALVLEAQPIILDCRGWQLLAITAVAQCYVWNVKTMVAMHPPVSLAPVLDMASVIQQGHLTNGPSLMFARLNSHGRIIVGMSNGDGYAYNSGMYIWQRLSETWWAVGSQYWNTADIYGSVANVANGRHKSKDDTSVIDGLSPENVSSAIIPFLERHTTAHALLKGRAYFLQRLVKQLLSAEGYEGFETAVSVGHLESRLAAAYMLEARNEYRSYLLIYARRLGAETARAKVEELLRSLLGRAFETDTGTEDAEETAASEDAALREFEWSASSHTILGWSRKDLLRDVILVLGKHRDLQRVTVPYARLLGVLNGSAGDDDGLSSTNGDVTMAAAGDG